MCGISGFWGGNLSSEESRSALNAMGSAIAHRGPDDSEMWLDASCHLGLAHRRLSIVDLSEAGRQPMLSSTGRFVMIFNGEVYNHNELRKLLNDSENFVNYWKGRSDTETLLRGIEIWGLEKTLSLAVGMFSIALWDKEKRVLSLARDRLGEKPLYYSIQEGTLVFGSELKALKHYPKFKSEIDRNALASFLQFNYVPAPLSIYQGVLKLEPGRIIDFVQNSDGSVQHRETKTYWTLSETIAQGQRSPFTGSDLEAIDELERHLSRAVQLQLLGDVPIGAFLSGGIDSSLIVALMQSNSLDPVKTFSIGFEEGGYNEAHHAKLVAKHLGTNHTELYVTPEEALDVIPLLPHIYDEPFADVSQIPTQLVAALARKNVTVALSGDGGDELFGGYNRYRVAPIFNSGLHKVPRSLRLTMASSLQRIPNPIGSAAFSMVSSVLPQRFRYQLPYDKFMKFCELSKATDPADVYKRLISSWIDSDNVVVGGSSLRQQSLTVFTPDSTNFQNWMMETDTLSYLPDDILAKVDRAAMSVSLETRIPFLDHRVLEFAWQLPLHFKIRNGETKWVTKQLLRRFIPGPLVDRPKMGFGVPIGQWLRGPLREWANDLLNEDRINEDGYLNPEPIKKLWLEHLNGYRNWEQRLWNILMFQSWLKFNNREIHLK
jgi:asparagine synthase (glutamine-hydrolysing)